MLKVRTPGADGRAVGAFPHPEQHGARVALALPPALARAAVDPALSARAVRALVILGLEPAAYTRPFPIKVVWLAHRLGVGRHAAGRALSQLEAHGYLLVDARRPRVARLVRG